MTQTSMFDYLIVDNFAGGGGASCGNAVPPPFAKALVMANCRWLCIKHCNNMAEFNSVAAG